jgi:hypothetical protein
MAEHTHSGPAELGAPMDYAEHQRTYARFVALTKIVILSGVVTLVALALYGFGSGGFWLGSLLIILMIVAAAVGLAADGSTKPLLVVTAISFLLLAISVG